MMSALFRWLETRVDVFAPFDERATPPATVWAFIWYHIREMKGWFVVMLITAFLFSAIEASLYLMLGWVIDLIAKTPPEVVFAEHWPVLAFFAVLLLIGRPVVYFANHAVVDQVVVPQLTNRIRWRSHVYTLGHALSYFQNDFAGRLSSRVIQAGQSVRAVTVETIDDMWYVLVFAGVSIAFFSTVSLWLALPVAAWMIGYGFLVRYFVPRATDRSEINSNARSAATGRIVDSYTNILTVKLFARGDLERSSVREALAHWAGTFLDLTRLITVVSVVLQTMNSLLIVVASAVSLWLWSRGLMTPGEMAAGIGLVLRLVQMSSWVIQQVRAIFEDIGTIKESMETIAKPHALVDAPKAAALTVSQGAIAFEHVRFGYGESGTSAEAARNAGDQAQPVFADLNLTIRPGERIGLIGPSGAGKSTLIGLLLRLHDVQGGRILIDGQDIAAVTQDSLRAAIATVTQDNALMHRSIGDNIAYGRPGADEASIERAARAASAHAFITALRDDEGRAGYQARVGERGVKLSGGQRQRIAIARVILKDAPILILDEATSALDSEVEAAIQDQLQTLMQGKTVIAIAHRLSTIASLDRLVVLDKGRIVDSGTHTELLTRGGLYARLWARQSGGFLALDDAAEAASGAPLPLVQA